MEKLVWLSDIHVTDKEDCVERARLERALDEINRIHPDAMGCILTGDLVDEGRPPEYEALRTTLAQSELPIWPVIGNHDEREAFVSALLAPVERMDGFFQYHIETESHDLMMLDTNLPGDDGGALCEERLDWLREKLARGRKPCLLFLHHAPGVMGLGPLDAIPLYHPETLSEILSGSRVTQICAGHVHMALSTTFAGIPLMTLRSLSYHNPYPWTEWDFENVPATDDLPQYGVIQLESTGHVIYSIDLKV